MKSYSDTLMRFLDKVKINPENQCWEWQACKCKDGYGQFSLKSKQWKAHRLSYLLFKGSLKDLFVLHKCDVTCCVNPDHLFLGTGTDNMQDMVNKSRHHYQKKTHCPQGHPYSKENTYVNNTGRGGLGRQCKTCSYLRCKSRYVKIKKDHCPHNHKYTPENTYRSKNPKYSSVRRCKICMKDAARKRQEKRLLLLQFC